MENEKKMETDILKIVLDTYNRIALWNNNDYDSDRQKSDALKIVSQDIVQNTLEGLMRGLNLKTNTEISRGDVKVGDPNAIKDSDSFEKTDEVNIFNRLFINKPKT